MCRRFPGSLSGSGRKVRAKDRVAAALVGGPILYALSSTPETVLLVAVRFLYVGIKELD